MCCCTTFGAAALRLRGKKEFAAAVWVRAIARAALCLMPQNARTSANALLSWGIWRSISFTILGALVVVLFYRSAKKTRDRDFRYLWLTMVLGFACYIPVVLLADTVPTVGVLMIPKTCVYVWSVLIGLML